MFTPSPSRPTNNFLFCITTGIAGASMLVRVAADDQVDLVDVEQLGVDARHRRRIGLVVVVDQLDRAGRAARPSGLMSSSQIFLRQQRRLAVGSEPAGQRHAEADLDRLTGLRRRRPDEQRPGQQRQYCNGE